MATPVRAHKDGGKVAELRSFLKHLLNAAPSSPSESQAYWDTTAHKEKVWDGSAWQQYAFMTDVSSNASQLQGQAGAYYLNRANHTGAQLSTTISDFNTAVDARVQAIVGAAPAALDTLVELAAALGNDANYAATVNTALGLRTQKYTATIGNGALTSIAVTHSLAGGQWVVAQAFDVATGALIDCDITLTSATQVTFGFAVAPATNAIRVVVIG